ncbi:MAG: glycosyltransferase family 2 protein [Lachnospiraceae bacterium]|nr:glycosyltransferase family 2 protein [Lachnospiraceae bacterium]
MQTPLISVIVPVYNIMEYLPRCVESIRKQTYPNLEIILMDDGSTDGTGDLCDKLAAGDSRIRVYHKKNGGSSSARNLALKLVKGEYIGFVDSDDYISENMYQSLYEGITKYDVRVAQIGRDEIDEQGNMLPNICEPPKEDVLIGHREFLKELLMHRGDCSFCTKLFHRSVLEGKEFPTGALNEDFHFLIELLPEIGQIVSLPPQTYHVFYRMGSNSRKKDKEQFSRVFADCVVNADAVLEMVHKENTEKGAALADEDRELAKIALRFWVFQRLEYMLHIPVSQMKRDNGFYRSVVKSLRRKWFQGLCNPYLTAKNKVYMMLFVIAPKGVRKLHKTIKKL